MMSPDQLEMLQQDISRWNSWRKQNLRVIVDLSGADLSAANLSKANLSAADLVGAGLREANLGEADLRWANLVGADLREVHLSKANLSAADLRGVHLRTVDLSEAGLSEADLRRADLSEADLSAANLSKANLREADLSAANLSKANLREADLREANLSGTNLSKANLSKANLSKANLSEANLSGATLNETTFGNVDLTGTIGLDTCTHQGPSNIDLRTLDQSKNLPINFLRGCGLSDLWIDYLPSLRGQAIEFYSCFISYSHADKAFARRLHDQLQGRGIRCWLDEHQLLPGDDIYDAVDRGIKLWDKVLLCCSRDALLSWWVDSEIASAFAKEQALMEQRKNKVLALIPLNLDDYLFDGEWENGKAQQVRTRLAADFRGWETDNNKFETGLDRLIKALRTDEHAREHPPPSNL